MDNQYKNKSNLPDFEKISKLVPESRLDGFYEKKISKEIETKKNTVKHEKEHDLLGSVVTKNDNHHDELIFEKELENILADGLGDLYQTLDQTQQEIFKQKGEETARSISLLLKNVKFKIYEVLNLIRNWLFLIPGINKFFLEQEAKIKTDKILQINLKNKKL
jgi:hypothetical protein